MIKFRKQITSLLLFAIAFIVFISYLKQRNKRNEYVNSFYSTLNGGNMFFGYMNEPSVCKAKNFQAVLVITSYVGNVEVRSAHRRTFPQSHLGKLNVTRIFSLSKIPENEIHISQRAVDNEQSLFGDILQGDFLEHYRNLTYKHIMGLNWTSTNCQTNYIIKVDDDTVFVLEKLLQLLSKKEYKTNDKLLLGFLLENTSPKREKQNKWYVTYGEYSGSDYPPYLSGWLYVTTPRVAKMLQSAASFYPYFWIDDIFVTGILRNDLNLQLQDIRSVKVWLEHYEQLECCKRNMIIKNQLCKYFIGTNGGRDNMIYDFNQAWRHCQRSNCFINNYFDERTDCILTNENIIHQAGYSQIKLIKI